ncbi:MAG TPA: ATP-binding protein [Polyangiaceae bacterium]|jgi:signal transduction histidine kinase|nr:ATP-binding protein [Polyangiaceae bacterium]
MPNSNPSQLAERPRELAERPQDWLAGGGDMGALVRELDWSKTTLGPLGSWPQSLRTTVNTCLNSRLPILVCWGAEQVAIYNDAYQPILGDKHPRAMGQRGAEIWPEVWSSLGPTLKSVVSEGKAVWSENQLLELDRAGFPEERYFTFSYSPIRREAGGIDGVSCAVTETTAHVLGERRSRTLSAIAQQTANATGVDEACRLAVSAIADNAADLPFALVYIADDPSHIPRLAAATGVSGVDGMPDDEHRIGARGEWPLDWVLTTGDVRLVEQEEFRRGLGALHCKKTSPPTQALLIPFALSDEARPTGVLVVGLSTALAVDEQYRSFLDLVAEHIATAAANGRAAEVAQQRTQKLAELDRAKTAFFSNVSHEFRTPLTLMLGPTEDALASPDKTLRGADLEMVHRNELRLLKLVNTLLEFSRIEAGRVEVAFEETDLAALTRDIAATFRSAFERAGLTLEIRCEAIEQAVFVDRDMWEKIVLNLLSNAFKFTFEGGTVVTLRYREGQVALGVHDTGVGIPTADLPRMFERFFRSEGTRSRSYEGSGIGLALVRDLAHLHGGEIAVESRDGDGTSFTVTIPTGKAHLPAERIGAQRESGWVAEHTKSYVSEALRWLPKTAAGESEAPPPVSVGEALLPGEAAPSNARIIVADDNADMREYLLRLLGRYWQVTAVADGAQALALALANAPDLVLTDIMMPTLDGFALLRALRDDPRTASVPVVMLSARVGEGPRVAGLAAGANDYLVKPFSGRELLTRVSTHLELGRLRRAADALLAEREQLLLREREARRDAEQASRAKDDFLAMLGHELRNPLAPIVTALQLLRLRGNDPALREHTIIERQVTHLTTLVDDLLDISRITQGKIELKRESVEMSVVVARAVEIASPLFEQRRHVLVVDVPVSGVAAFVDPTRFAQVVSNLLTNAAKYTEVGGRILISAESTAGAVTLTVSDNGIGMTEDMLPRIFDIFMQERQASDRAHGGLGLGLAIVRSLVQMHGGTVSASSGGRGAGSSFVIGLPAVVAAERPQLETPLVSPAQVVPGGVRRVLVVDDNTDAAELLARAMSEFGCETQIAHDGPSALALIDSFRPELALLDIGLPVMDGYELAQLIRNRPHAGPIHLVAVTGYGQKSDIEQALAAGFDEHLTKPVDILQLKALVSGIRSITPPP